MEKRGWIEVVCGPMFAGKSEELIRRIKRMQYAKKKFLVFKPLIDDRYSNTQLVSHDKNGVDSINAASSKDVLAHINDDLDAIVIDEVQFLDDEIVNVCDEFAKKGVRVICGGLDNNFKDEPFLITAKLMSRAEQVTKLTAICVKCGEPATCTQRLINGKPASKKDPIILDEKEELFINKTL